MSEFNIEVYPDEIAEALIALAARGKEADEQLLVGKLCPIVLNECEEAISHLKADAENPYNSEYFRTLYKVFEEIVKTNDLYLYEREQ